MKRFLYSTGLLLALSALLMFNSCSKNTSTKQKVSLPEDELLDDTPTETIFEIITSGTLGTFGEAGKVAFNQVDGNTWHTLNLVNTYTDPVVIMQPLSYNGAFPATIRLKNVTGSKFKFQIDEWDYLNGAHGSETASYLVIEAGAHRLSDCRRIVAGKLQVKQNFKTVNFTRTFRGEPVVLTQSQTYAGAAAITTRQKNISNKSFKVKLQEEEASNGTHAFETVGFIAIDAGSGNLGGKNYEIVKTPDAVKHQWYNLSFIKSYSDPLFLAGMQTYNGSDPATLRYRNLTGTNTEIKVEEEKSADAEVGHGTEIVGFFVFEAGFAFDGGSLTNNVDSDIQGLERDTILDVICDVPSDFRDAVSYIDDNGNISANRSWFRDNIEHLQHVTSNVYVDSKGTEFITPLMPSDFITNGLSTQNEPGDDGTGPRHLIFTERGVSPNITNSLRRFAFARSKWYLPGVNQINLTLEDSGGKPLETAHFMFGGRSTDEDGARITELDMTLMYTVPEETWAMYMGQYDYATGKKPKDGSLRFDPNQEVTAMFYVPVDGEVCLGILGKVSPDNHLYAPVPYPWRSPDTGYTWCRSAAGWNADGSYNILKRETSIAQPQTSSSSITHGSHIMGDGIIYSGMEWHQPVLGAEVLLLHPLQVSGLHRWGTVINDIGDIIDFPADTLKLIVTPIDTLGSQRIEFCLSNTPCPRP